MKYLYELLKKHKPKHNLNFWLELQDLNGDNDLNINFTIFGNDWNNSIRIYTFDSFKEQKKKVEKIKKLLNNKRKALLFIGNRDDIQ